MFLLFSFQSGLVEFLYQQHCHFCSIEKLLLFLHSLVIITNLYLSHGVSFLLISVWQIDNMSMHSFNILLNYEPGLLFLINWLCLMLTIRSYIILFFNFMCYLKFMWTFVSIVNCTTSQEWKGVWFCSFKIWFIIFKYIFSVAVASLDELICVLQKDTTNIYCVVANILPVILNFE